MTEEKKRASSSWRSEFGPDEVIQRVRPHETDAYLLNPHKGTTTFQRFNGDPLFPGTTWNDREGPETFTPFGGDLKNPRYPDTTIAYCRWLWSRIEPEKGNFRWDFVDGALEAARVRGQTLQVRIQPYIGEAIPEWYWRLGGTPCEEELQRSGRRVPDHNTEAYLKHWGDLIRAFGGRYDGHPDLESFDVAYGGPCGETGGNARPETAARLVDVYLESFQKTQLLSMLGTDGCTYAAAQREGIGWRADCYGDLRMAGEGVVPPGLNWKHMYDLYPMEVEVCGVKDAWKRAPVTLETCWTVGHWHEQGWDIDWILEQGYKYHLSVFMPKSSYIPAEWSDSIQEFNKRMGYRFVLRQMVLPLGAKPGQQIEYSAWIDNLGVAPIYRPYKFAFRFRQDGREEIVRSGQDIRTWMPDHTWFQETITFPKELVPGVAEVDVGIVHPDTNEPVVKFAIEEVLDDNWHPMTKMDVLSTARPSAGAG